jgi:hypothetical protein
LMGAGCDGRCKRETVASTNTTGRLSYLSDANSHLGTRQPGGPSLKSAPALNGTRPSTNKSGLTYDLAVFLDLGKRRPGENLC